MLDLVERTLSVAGRDLTLQIPRDLEALFTEEAFAHEEFVPYWAELWPSALALAEVVGDLPAGTRVLEIGCGLGVPSLVAARSGLTVTAADWAPDAISVLRDNAARNGAHLTSAQWSWTADPAPLDPPFDLVIAADVLYEHRNVAPLLAVLPALAPQVWVADPGRLPTPEFLAGAATSWAVDRIPHPGPPTVTIHRLRRPA